MILSVDPGCALSAWLVLSGGGEPLESGKHDNRVVSGVLEDAIADNPGIRIVIEGMQSYGMMQVGAEVFETAYWVGEFRHIAKTQAAGRYELVKRTDVKLHHCGNVRAKDPHVRRAMLDRFGISGNRVPKDSVLAGITADIWSALAIATYAYDKMREKA